MVITEVIIKSGAGANETWTIDTGSTAARVTLYDKAGTASKYIPTFCGTASSYRTIGSAASPQSLLTIENKTGSGKIVYVKQIWIQNDTTATLTTVGSDFSISRITSTLPSANGTTLTKGTLNSGTTSTSNSNVVIFGAASADGNTGHISATGGTYLFRQFSSRLTTLVGFAVVGPKRMLPYNFDDRGGVIVLRENQGIVVQVLNTTAASNANTNHYIVTVRWDEV